ncbi:MAG: transporter [Chromatiaceae bacterium]|nr:transporter [Chromatiaceae bacterium]
MDTDKNPNRHLLNRRLVFPASLLHVVMWGIAPSALPTAAIADTSTEIAELKAAVARRDAIIDELLDRVVSLEQRWAQAKVAAAPASSDLARPNPSPNPAPSDRRSRPNTAPRPGVVEVDPLAAERALERTLTQEGVLLLPAGQFELEPYVAYARRETDQPTLVIDPRGVAAGSIESRRNEWDLGLRGRAGLPWDTQLELDIPYRYVSQSLVQPSSLNGLNEAKGNGSSLGDIKVGFAKTLLQQDQWWPDLVARLTWDSDTGERFDNDLALGIGFSELRGSLSALARQDPLALTASLSYETTFEKDNIDPGDELGISFGVSLAASPETSLSMSLAQTFAQETRIGGQAIPGSDETTSVMAFGASFILGRNLLLSLSAVVGLTDSAPDYAFAVSLPIRF